MNQQEKHYEDLLDQIREHRATPSPGVEARYTRRLSGYRPLFRRLAYAVAASLALLVTMQLWFLPSAIDPIHFADDDRAERFEADPADTDPIYRVDGNFYALHRSYEELMQRGG